MHFDLLGWEATGVDTYVLTIRAESRRFNGTGDLQLTMRDGLIARLEIG